MQKQLFKLGAIAIMAGGVLIFINGVVPDENKGSLGAMNTGNGWILAGVGLGTVLATGSKV